MKSVNPIQSLLRILAAFLIVIYHYSHFLMISDYTYAFPQLAPIYYYGYLAVEFFFMLSGFSLSGGYCVLIANQRISFSEFMKKRVIKLYPGFLVTNLITFVLSLVYKIKTGVGFLQNPYALNLLVSILPISLPGPVPEGAVPMNDPTWFVAPLLLMYVLFYFISQRSETGKLALWMICIVFSGLFHAFPVLNGLPIIGGRTHRALLTFSIGAILHIVYQRFPKETTNLSLFLISTCVFGFCLTQKDFIGWDQTGFERVFTYVVFPSIIALSCFFGEKLQIRETKRYIYIRDCVFAVPMAHAD